MWPINKKLTNLKKDLMGNVGVEFRLNLSSRSGEEDLEEKKIQNKMAAEPSDRWHHNFFSAVNCVDDAQEISDFSYAAFYLTNFHRDTASLMTSRKITPLPPLWGHYNVWSEIFLHCTVSEIEVQRLSVFSRWRPYHVTYDVTIIN